jgi:hypothetical protein
MIKCKDMENMLNVKRLESKLQITQAMISDLDKYVRDAGVQPDNVRDYLREVLSEIEMFLMSK